MSISKTLNPLPQAGHVGLNVSDLKRSITFYQEVFGFLLIKESQEDDRRFAFLGDGQTTVITLWEQSEGRFERGRPGLHHLSFRVGTIDEVREIEQRLKTRDVHLLYEGIVPHSEGAESGGLFFEDPDGLRLEVFSPTGANIQAAPVPGAPSCGFF